MYKVLFVDDEKGVLDYLPLAIDWKKLDITELFISQDAREALEIVKQQHPNIAIVDVEMPGMDGLEFCREARKICPEIKFVILSAYDRFDYAKRAIRIGVDDYLLKPVDEEELAALMTKIVKQLSGTRKEQQNRHTERIYAMEKAAGELFHGLLHGRENGTELEKNFELAERYRNFCIVMQENTDSSDCRDVLRKSTEQGGLFLVLDEGFYLLLWEKDPVISMEQKIDDLKWKLKRKGYHTLIASVYAKKEETFSKTFTRCFHELEVKFYQNHDEQKRISRKPFEKIQIQVPDLKDGLEELSAEGDVSELRKKIHTALDHAFERYAEPVRICSMMMDVLITLKVYLTKYSQEESIHLFRKIETDTLLRCGSPSGLYDLIDTYLSELQFFVRKRQKEHGNFYIIKAAKVYTKENYQNSNLTLQDVADAAGTSRTYFSSLFRELTGEKYWDYLSRYRIERAKELLIGTNLGQAEICTRVGYESEFHFSRKFKEIVGVSPNKFRKQ